MAIHRLLHSSFFFLNTTTAITWQLIRTARTLEAEWWQVSGECVGTGTKENESSTGRVWAAGFHHFTARSAWRAFGNLWIVYFFNFPKFFHAALNRGYWIHGYGDPPVQSFQYKTLWINVMSCLFLCTDHASCIFFISINNTNKTIQLLKPCNKGNKTRCWESFYTHIFQQQNTLIDEQKANDLNPLHTLATITRRHVMQSDIHHSSVLTTQQTRNISTG